MLCMRVKVPMLPDLLSHRPGVPVWFLKSSFSFSGVHSETARSCLKWVTITGRCDFIYVRSLALLVVDLWVRLTLPHRAPVTLSRTVFNRRTSTSCSCANPEANKPAVAFHKFASDTVIAHDLVKSVDVRGSAMWINSLGF